MPRHLEIELTSTSENSTWTWRAAGAREPRGTLESSLVPAGSQPGAIFRAQVASGLEGIEIVALEPVGSLKPASDAPERIAVLGPSRLKPGVTVTLAKGQKSGSKRSERRAADGDGKGHSSDAKAGRRRQEPKRADRVRRGRTELAGALKRPTSMVHRNAVLATLPPEQLPVAEQLLRGGMPSVRRAIDEQNAQEKANGRPPVAADALLEMAEELQPVIRLAEWKDRASSVATDSALGIKELRSLVAGSRVVTLDDEGKAIAKSLQEELAVKVGAVRDRWISQVTAALDEGDVLAALKVSARPPEPGTRCPSDLAVRLAAAAGEAMTGELHEEDWFGLLEAVLASPVKRTVKPKGIPAGDGVKTRALSAAGSVPALAHLLGVRVPPPPPPSAGKVSGGLNRARRAGPRAGS
ncbi:MAG: hypothetical protein ACYDEP_07415 [Acidimicrobiales bacterium]